MSTTKGDGKAQDTSKQQPAGLPNRDQLVKAVEIEQKIAKAQVYASSLREKAAQVADPKERERLIKEAYEREVEAHGNSTWAQRLQSGPWQGLAAGTGIGLGTGLGIGTVVGVLVGGLVSIPTTGLGALIGTGVGAINGPFIKFGGKDTRWEDAPPEEVVSAIEQEYAAKQELSPSEKEAPTPTAGEMSSIQSSDTIPRKKKPRKIEIRSQQNRPTSEELDPLPSEAETPNPD